MNKSIIFLLISLSIILTGCATQYIEPVDGPKARLSESNIQITHEIADEVIKAAKENPDGWVYKIEGEFGPHDPIPPEAIVGAWKVDKDGVLTGEFLENPNYKSTEL